MHDAQRVKDEAAEPFPVLPGDKTSILDPFQVNPSLLFHSISLLLGALGEFQNQSLSPSPPFPFPSAPLLPFPLSISLANSTENR